MVDGIYIHIPFCLNKCNYCDFLSFKSNKESRKKYVDYLLKEIELYPSYKYNTVYFGGGTPSLLDLEDIERILEKLDIEEGAEVTLEVNPKTVDYDKLVQLKKIGINRLSIGIQSFDEKYLRILGRMHSSEEGIETYYNARKAGFENILKGHKALPPQIILIEPPAQGVFGTGRRLPSGYLRRHADKFRQKRIVFHFQHRARLHCAHVENFRIQEIHTAKPGADIPI